MSSKRGLVIISAITAMVIAIVAFLKLRFRSQIVDVRWETKVPKHIDISWYDEEPDKMYKIYWSNQPGIKINIPQTYRHVTKLTTLSLGKRRGRRLARVRAPYEWCYFVIAKESSNTSEYEASVMQDTSFTCSNLEPEIIGRKDGTLTLNVNVLEHAETYRVYQYLPSGDAHFDDFHVEGMKTVNLKIPLLEDAMIFIASLRGGFEHAPEFLAFNEKFLSDEAKWATRTKLC